MVFQKKDESTAHKIVYYAMHVLRVPSDILTTIVRQLRARSERFEEEDGLGEAAADDIVTSEHSTRVKTMSTL